MIHVVFSLLALLFFAGLAVSVWAERNRKPELAGTASWTATISIIFLVFVSLAVATINKDKQEFRKLRDAFPEHTQMIKTLLSTGEATFAGEFSEFHLVVGLLEKEGSITPEEAARARRVTRPGITIRLQSGTPISTSTQ